MENLILKHLSCPHFPVVQAHIEYLHILRNLRTYVHTRPLRMTVGLSTLAYRANGV